MAEPQTPSTATSFPTSVNSQITDAITQANTKVLGDAPAIAMGNLYQATAQALSNAAHNATTAQQQSYITAQASTTMGVTTLYSLDTASTGVATQDILSKKETPELLQTQVNGAVAALNASMPTTTSFAVDSPSGPDEVLRLHEAFAEAVRSTMGAFADSLDRLNCVAYTQLLDIIKLAGTTACLTAMIKSPEKTEEYQRILEIIKDLE